MTAHRTILVVGLTALALVGCEVTDGTAPQDARVWEGSDASVWQPLSIDAGAMPDAGDCDMSLPPLDASLLPLCAAATRPCLLDCTPGDQNCQNDCYLADSNPGCSDCITLQAIACADVSGCHPQVSAFMCCNAANCPMGSAEGCAGTYCATEIQALFACLGSTASACGDYYDPTYVGACFPPEPADAGPMDTDAGAPADGGV